MASATTWTLDGNSTAEEVYDKIVNFLDYEMDMNIVNRVFGGMDLEFGIERNGIWIRERRTTYTGDINEPVPFWGKLVNFSGELNKNVLEKVLTKLCVSGNQRTPLWCFFIRYPDCFSADPVGMIYGCRR